jgi:hypothetical protein
LACVSRLKFRTNFDNLPLVYQVEINKNNVNRKRWRLLEKRRYIMRICILKEDFFPQFQENTEEEEGAEEAISKLIVEMILSRFLHKSVANYLIPHSIGQDSNIVFVWR